MGNSDELYVIYADGFLQSKRFPESAGCTVAVEFNDTVVYRRRFFVKKEDDALLRRFLSSRKVTTGLIEYYAVTKAVTVAKKLFKSKGNSGCMFYVYSDSMTTIMQMNDEWNVDKDYLRHMKKVCIERIGKMNVSFFWVARRKMVELLGH